MTFQVLAADGRTLLRMERELPHSPERIWCLVSDPAQLSAWWPMRAESLPLQQNAPVKFVDETGNTSEGVITDLEMGRVLGFTDEVGLHRVRFEIVPSGAGCLLRFEHFFPESDDAAQHEQGWRKCFAIFDRVLAAQAAGAS